MKQKTQKNNSFQKLPRWAKISFCVAVALILLVIISTNTNIGKNQSNSQTDGSKSTMTITEAQDKCVILTFIGFKKANYENATKEEANRHCLAMWDSPEREKTFIEYVTKEWEANKSEVYDGKTVEQIYNESIKH